jgi:hypothetical protein
MTTDNRETCRRYRTKLQPGVAHRKPWSASEDQCALDTEQPLLAIARQLKRTVGAVATRR